MSNSEIKINNQEEVGETGPASSSQRTENDVWTETELSAAIRGIRDTVTNLSNELNVLKKNKPGSSTENRNSEYLQFPETNVSQSLPTRASLVSVFDVETVSITLWNK